MGALAERLTDKASDLIIKYGNVATLSITSVVYDAATGVGASAKVDTTVRVTPFELGKVYRGGSTVIDGTFTCYLSGEGISDIPPGASLKVGSTTYRVERSVRVLFQDTTVLHQVWVI